MVFHGFDHGTGADVARLLLGGVADLVGEDAFGEFAEGLRKIAGGFRQGRVLCVCRISADGSGGVAWTGLGLRLMTWMVLVVMVVVVLVVVMVRMVHQGLFWALWRVRGGCRRHGLHGFQFRFLQGCAVKAVVLPEGLDL